MKKNSHRSNEEVIVGTSGRDILYGSPDHDVIIFGNEGNDEIGDVYGLDQFAATNDKYYGNEGNDILDSWKGDDFLFGNTGNDELRVVKHAGKTVLDGGMGEDTAILYGFTQHLVVVTEKDDRTIYEQGGAKVVVMDDVENISFQFEYPHHDW